MRPWARVNWPTSPGSGGRTGSGWVGVGKLMGWIPQPTQAQIQRFELAHPNMYPICEMLGESQWGSSIDGIAEARGHGSMTPSNEHLQVKLLDRRVYCMTQYGTLKLTRWDFFFLDLILMLNFLLWRRVNIEGLENKGVGVDGVKLTRIKYIYIYIKGKVKTNLENS